MKIYTKNGDQGNTQLVDGSSVNKSDLRIESYGTVDELNSQIGVLRSSLQGHRLADPLDEYLDQIQVWLFQLGSQLACTDSELAKQLPNLSDSEIQSLEAQIDNMDGKLPKLKNFILPGGHAMAAQAHICRVVSRRAERHCVHLNQINPLGTPAIPFLNRLSDYFFVLARFINHETGTDSKEWVP